MSAKNTMNTTNKQFVVVIVRFVSIVAIVISRRLVSSWGLHI